MGHMIQSNLIDSQVGYVQWSLPGEVYYMTGQIRLSTAIWVGDLVVVGLIYSCLLLLVGLCTHLSGCQAYDKMENMTIVEVLKDDHGLFV